LDEQQSSSLAHVLSQFSLHALVVDVALQIEIKPDRMSEDLFYLIRFDAGSYQIIVKEQNNRIVLKFMIYFLFVNSFK